MAALDSTEAVLGAHLELYDIISSITMVTALFLDRVRVMFVALLRR